MHLIRIELFRIFRCGRFYYVVWFDDFSEEDEEDEEMEDQESDTYDVEVESIYDENDYEDDDEDVPTDEDELEEDPLLPVAIDGPFTIDEIRNMVKKGII